MTLSHRFFVAPAAWLCALSGCYEGLASGTPDDESAPGSGADGSTDTDADEGGSSGADDDGSELPEQPLPPAGWYRLSRIAYRNTVADLLTYASDATIGGDAFAGLESVLSTLPADDTRDYDSFDQSTSQAHVDAYFEIGMRIGAEMTSSTERLAAFVGTCASDADPSNDAGCLDAFVERFGRLAHRRALAPAELAFYRDEVYPAGDAIEADAVADLVAVITTSPKFLYRVELGDADFSGEQTMRVSDDELASRISYLLWQSMPDPELLAAAEDGSLATAEGLTHEVDRLFHHARAQASFGSFFAHWLELQEQPNLAGAVADPAYAALVGAQAPSPELAAEMAAEVDDSIRYHVWTAGDGVDGWLASPYAFPRSAELAAIYGVATWDGQSEPPLASSARAGLLTRPALLAATSMRSRPILRGSLIRKRLLCETLPPPPPDAQGAAGVPAPTDGARAWTEAVTSSAGCAACHSLINPLGFALEGFDSLGRERADERLFDDEGTLAATLPVDSSARVSIGPVTRDVDGPHGLVDAMLESTQVQACIAQEYVRWAYGRDIDPDSADAVLVDQLAAMLTEGEPFATVLAALALHPTFRVRGWEAP